MGILDSVPYALTGGTAGTAPTKGVPSFLVISGPQTVGGQAIPYTQTLGRTSLQSGVTGGRIGATVYQGSPFFRARSPLAASREFYQSGPGRRLTQSAPGSAKLARDIANMRNPTLPKRRKGGGNLRRSAAGGGFGEAMGGGMIGSNAAGLGAALSPVTLFLIGGAVILALALGVRRNR